MQRNKKVDLIGKIFNRLQVIESAGSNELGRSLWKCQCDCGKISIVLGYSLIRGNTQSCGCLHIDNVTKHHESQMRLYGIWQQLRARCSNPKHASYHSYGGRGISVCEEWNHSYENFRDWAMLNGYEKDLSIDRIDNDKGYSPDNCRWANRITQQNNMSNNHMVIYNGAMQTLAQLCRKHNKNYALVQSRLRRGWSIEDSLYIEKFGLHKKDK